MKRIKNIVIVNDFDYIQGGASKVSIDTANLLAEHTENINIYFFSGKTNKSSTTLNSRIIKVTVNQNEALKDRNRIRGIVNGIYNIKAKIKFKKLLKKLKSEETIIHIHGWTKCLSSSVIDIAFKMKFKVVLTLHDYFIACPNGGFYNYKCNQICKLNPLSYKCLKCNCDSRNYLFKMYRVIRQFIQNKIVKLPTKLHYAIGISDLSIKVLKPYINSSITLKKIYNPIEFKHNEEKVNYSKNDYFLYVGRVSKEKGVDIFCKVITELNLKGIVVGDGSEKNRLTNEFSNIEFVGWKTSEEVFEYMKKARCLIFPSLWYEGAPLTPLEAMSIGIPCLINDNCAGREYYAEFNYKNIDELKQKIVKLINNDNYKEFNFEFLEYFTTYKYIENIKSFYNEIINS